MSYINFAFNVVNSVPGSPRTTLDAGFSREGGRLDHLTRSTQPIAPVPPSTVTVDHANPDIATAGTALRDALLGAEFIRTLTLERGNFDAPTIVRWTPQSGGRGSVSSINHLPNNIRAVLEAAQSLDAAAVSLIARQRS